MIGFHDKMDKKKHLFVAEKEHVLDTVSDEAFVWQISLRIFCEFFILKYVCSFRNL